MMKNRTDCVIPQTVRQNMMRRMMILSVLVVVTVFYYLAVDGLDTTPVTYKVTDMAETAATDAMNKSEIYKVSVVTSQSTSMSTTENNLIFGKRYPHKYILNKPNMCSVHRLNIPVNELSVPPVKILITVMSAPLNALERLAIRRTWGNPTFRSDIRILFLVGVSEDSAVQKRMLEEDAEYQDLIQEDFIDSYRNLTLKSTMMLRWAATYCPQTQFLLKVDDDVFVNIPELVSYVSGLKNTNSIVGRVWKKVKPIRDVKNKWHVTDSEFKGSHFPDYTGGPSYVIGGPAIAELLKAAMDVPRPLFLEDVFITGICAEKAKIPRTSQAKFAASSGSLDACNFRDLITIHGISANMQYVGWWFSNDKLFEQTCHKKPGDSNTCPNLSSERSALVEFANYLVHKMDKLK